jgi:hypothetical protein
MATDMVTAEFVLLSDSPQYKTLLVPSWVRNPTMVPRRDRKNELLIRVTRRYKADKWLILPEQYRSGMLLAFRILGEGHTLGDPRDVRFEVHVPLRIYMDFAVRQVSPA